MPISEPARENPSSSYPKPLTREQQVFIAFQNQGGKAGVDLRTGLVAWIELEETLAASRLDSSPLANHFALNADNPVAVNAVVGNGNDFSTWTQWVGKAAPATAFAGLNRSVAFWAKTVASNGLVVVSKWTSPANREYRIELNANTNIRAYYSTTGANESLASQVLPETESWHHYVVTFEPGFIVFYVDGALSKSQAVGGPIFQGTALPMIGGFDGHGQFQGTLDQVIFWDRTVDLAVAVALYNGGAGRPF